jgi:predicted MPP superfamily phosphohydrolase
MGIHCVQRNHDPDAFMEQLPDLGINTIGNGALQVKHPTQLTFNLAGVNGLFRDAIVLVKMIEHVDPDLFTIGMCHYPELGDPLAAAGIDLTLAGHTHGGQICLPGGKSMQHHSRSGTRFVKSLQR